MSAEWLGARVSAALAAASRPAAGLEHVRTETLVPAPLDETFSFFSQASNLERLTPAWVNFRIRTPLPIVMGEGLVIEYQIVLYGVPIPWRSRIDVWEPGVRFVDRQITGPYRWWRHEHTFEPRGPETLMRDHVEFVPRLPWLTRRFVRRDVERIFSYRQRTLLELFARPPARDTSAAPARAAFLQHPTAKGAPIHEDGTRQVLLADRGHRYGDDDHAARERPPALPRHGEPEARAGRGSVVRDVRQRREGA